MLRLTSRYYRTIPIDQTGYETEIVELDPKRTALIGMHCWNIGCEGGPDIDPNYCVGMGFYESFREADRIMRECIRPAMDAARKAGVLVCHVESPTIGAKRPEAQKDIDPPEKSQPIEEVVPGWRKEMEDRFHGRDFGKDSPYARMDRAEIVAPLAGEPFVYQTRQFHRILRRHGIENLIYTGFATDMCILRSPGGIEQMAPYSYRIFLARDATFGVECPDTFKERLATRWALRYFETHYGDTILIDDFIRACKAW